MHGEEVVNTVLFGWCSCLVCVYTGFAFLPSVYKKMSEDNAFVKFENKMGIECIVVCLLFEQAVFNSNIPC